MKQRNERVARRWEIAENLHRAELTDLQRKEQVAEWIGLVEAEAAEEAQKLGQLDRVFKGGRGKTGGISAAARELPLSGRSEEGRRKSAERAVRVAAIAPEAKAAVRAAGLDNNQRALLRVAAAPKGEQVATVAAIVTEKAERAAERSPEITFEVWIEEGRRWLSTGTPDFQARAREALPFPETQGDRA
ncbi:hypothetical protein MKK64_19135 [Methylobacterium sp. E-025]|uniref:hypothetical protein n=1 Tax=Methylobacterium sp. E-025 TaxID=2836561 RepID=UPI001FB94267|nr:hypothetical protein [Methylobacterium sp. E-025]MCJ2113294.1 hypothetical protein [Methylobacterium sp. E-025]